eukprot:gnl/Trimastix_PCT/1704.p1 GENE.gnl/Trimastix_PCT/1704~~gnl/Trimastix_PCT/1704.p1  ORF type:complete len:524 (+),score=72.11 gnl/Trimastix_PCT/1704:101-1672(+)
MASILKKVKNRIFATEIERHVKEATDSSRNPPDSDLMLAISDATHRYEDYNMIMAVIYQRLEQSALEGKNFRKVYKALLLLEYVIRNGSGQVIDDVRRRLYVLKRLMNFHHIDERHNDQGANIREKAKDMVAFVQDDSRVQEEREKASSMRDKYRGLGSGQWQGCGSGGSTGGGFAPRPSSSGAGVGSGSAHTHAPSHAHTSYSQPSRYGSGIGSGSADSRYRSGETGRNPWATSGASTGYSNPTPASTRQPRRGSYGESDPRPVQSPHHDINSPRSCSTSTTTPARSVIFGPTPTMSQPALPRSTAASTAPTTAAAPTRAVIDDTPLIHLGTAPTPAKPTPAAAPVAAGFDPRRGTADPFAVGPAAAHTAPPPRRPSNATTFFDPRGGAGAQPAPTAVGPSAASLFGPGQPTPSQAPAAAAYTPQARPAPQAPAASSNPAIALFLEQQQQQASNQATAAQVQPSPQSQAQAQASVWGDAGSLINLDTLAPTASPTRQQTRGPAISFKPQPKPQGPTGGAFYF